MKKVIVPPQPSGSLVKEGLLFKRGELITDWRPRWFSLYSDGSLIGYKDKTGSSPSRTTSKLNNSFNVKGCKIMKTYRPNRYTFIVRGLRPNKIKRAFSVDSEEEREGWIHAIEAISDALSRAESSSSSSSPSSASPTSLLSKKKQSPGSLGDNTSGGSSSSEEEQHFGKKDSNLSRQFGNLGISSGRASEEEKVTLEDFELLKVLGRGTFGKVMLCREKSSKKLYAIKILDKEVVIRKNEVEHTLAEKRVLQMNTHPFLISLKCSFQTKERLCFVMEYVRGGELFVHLREARRFSEARTRFYAAEIILALEHLHRHGIIYRDVKLENLLLDQDGHIKITDFGLCKENMFFGSRTYTLCGTLGYLAPEVTGKINTGYTRAVDYWGVGVISYEMMAGCLPFPIGGNESLRDRTVKDELQFPSHFSENAIDLLTGLLQKNPTERLGGGRDDAEEIKKHPFFSSINWSDLDEKKIPVPFTPEVTSEIDTRYFDKVFTDEPVELTPPPVRKPLNRRVSRGASADHYDFGGFSYLASSFGASAKSTPSPLDM